MTDPDVPLTTRGVPRTRFDPLRDAPRAENANLSPEDTLLLEIGADDAEKRVLDVVSAVRRQIVALGLADTPEGAMAVTAAEKAADATGSAAAACLHELRMIMDAIRASKPVGEVKNPTEDVLSRRRERRTGA